MKLLLLIWQLPQYLLGHLIARLLHSTKDTEMSKTFNGLSTVYTCKQSIGVSFGPVIIYGTEFKTPDDMPQCTNHHEHGHARQSQYLGPLYLVIVGLPSIIMNLMSTYSILYGTGQFYNNYYNRFPENWADNLGGVKHSLDGTRIV